MKYHLIVVLLLFINALHAQEANDKVVAPFMEAEIMGGSIVPNHLDYPPSAMRAGIAFTSGREISGNNSLARYFRTPKVGLTISAHTLGNDTIFGNEVSLIPFVELRTWQHWSFKLGLGLSYFSKTYDDNSLNRAVGSHITWGFHSFLYRYIPLKNERSLKLGFGFLHGSNGHTQLPNYGINSAVLTVALQNLAFNTQREKDESLSELPKTWDAQLRFGYGWHEFGGTTKPIGGEKKAVYTQTATVGLTFKKHFKLYSGFGYRHYQSFADSLRSTESPELEDVSPTNIFYVLGIELLLDHVGLSIEGGLNLYKPFYPHFAAAHESTSGWDYYAKKLFLSRLGLNVYAINTSKQPKHNVFLGAHLNANFGEADFTEVSLGYIYRIK
jgi:hypothetical protein